jgi:hypothetical protein
VDVQISLTAEEGGFESALVHWDSGDRSGTIPVPWELGLRNEAAAP